MTESVESPVCRHAPGDIEARLAERPVRVLHLNAGNLYGGVETLIKTLATLRQLCPGMEPHFAVCYEGRSSKELEASGAPVYFLGAVRISRPWTVLRARARLRELLQREHFDLVICHMSWTLAVFGPAVRAAHCALAVWAHGFHAQGSWLERLAQAKRPDFVIANSRFTADRVKENFPGAPIRAIYCPMPLQDTPEGDQWRSSVRIQEGVPDDTTVILQVGRLESWKGHATHLRALSELGTSEKWVCWMVGGAQTAEEQQYLANLQELTRQLGLSGRVRFLGQRTDVPKLLAAADIFCQPNQTPEPFGLVFIESLWAQRPVLTTSLGGALEIVDESCGLLVNPEDPKSLAEALRRLIQSPDLRRRLGEAGAKRAKQLCDPVSQMEKLREYASSEIDRLRAS